MIHFTVFFRVICATLISGDINEKLFVVTITGFLEFSFLVLPSFCRMLIITLNGKLVLTPSPLMQNSWFIY